jgi:hypothetical protein
MIKKHILFIPHRRYLPDWIMSTVCKESKMSELKENYIVPGKVDFVGAQYIIMGNHDP